MPQPNYLSQKKRPERDVQAAFILWSMECVDEVFQSFHAIAFLPLHHQRAGDHIVQCLLFVCKTGHDETDEQDNP